MTTIITSKNEAMALAAASVLWFDALLLTSVTSSLAHACVRWITELCHKWVCVCVYVCVCVRVFRYRSSLLLR